MKKLLYVGMHRPNRSPTQRFRFDHYLPHFRAAGYDVTYSNLISAQADRFYYKPGYYLNKAGLVLRSAARRLAESLRAESYDLIFVERAAFMAGPAMFERLFARSGTPMIWDVDDAIFVHQISDANRLFGWLKSADKTDTIARVADEVFAGNDYLADYARRFNDNVQIVPTTIDTDEYTPPDRTRPDGAPVCIGWSGSFSTVQHFETVIPALERVKERLGDRVTFRVIGDGDYRYPALGIVGQPWRHETEIADLAALDVGVMPLPDDEWSRGKCGLKGLQYMALEIATVMSPVGVNSEIVQHGENGMLASTEDEWVEVLVDLVEDAEKRERLGRAGRETIVRDYSVETWAPRIIERFDALTGASQRQEA